MLILTVKAYNHVGFDDSSYLMCEGILVTLQCKLLVIFLISVMHSVDGPCTLFWQPVPRDRYYLSSSKAGNNNWPYADKGKTVLNLVLHVR